MFKLAMEKGDPVSFINMGVLQMRKGDLEEAYSCFFAITEGMYRSLHSGTRSKGHAALAVLLEVMSEGASRTEEIVRHLDLALSLDPCFATQLTSASYRRRYQDPSNAKELYSSVSKYDHYSDYDWLVDLETMGWWDEYDKAFIRKNVAEEIKPLW
jgi:hypothetical protein